MIHYHGTPMTPRAELWGMSGKSFCVSFAEHRDADICLNIGQSVMWDNGAFSFFTKKKETDWEKFYAWVEPRLGHPHWAVVPDVIDGSEEDNLRLIKEWPHREDCAAVVWHLSESIDHLLRLEDLCFGKIAFGSSGKYWKVGSSEWERRIDEAFNALAKHGPLPWVHMMRGLAMGGKHWPFASADSTNVTLHYAEQGTTAEYMARQIDGNQCPINWKLKPTQKELLNA
tara:strand:+ start:1197 stop:1880 length:684 start_codon:yes stop_codon:yes gene_type:complete